MSQKRFPPTARQLKKARQEGNIAKSSAVTSLFSITIGFGWVFFYLDFAWEYLVFLVKLNAYQVILHPQISFRDVLLLSLFFSGLLITPFVGSSIFAEVAQLGWSISFRNPLRQQSSAAQRAWKMAVNNVKTLWLPVVAFVGIGWAFLCYHASVKDFLITAWSVLLVAVIVDYGLKRYTWYCGLMMDHHQMKEEHREAEGDPHAKAYRQAMQRAISMQSLEERVRRAKVIVVGKNAKSFCTTGRGQ